MPVFGSIKRNDLISCFHRLGFEGPYSGTKHQFMVRKQLTVHIPNPHRGDIGRDLLARILRQAHITKEEWEQLR
jgi:predicted RNA binding protein YcfA (HicA-like mRNA interferase family)